MWDLKRIVFCLKLLGFILFKEQFLKHINYKTVRKDLINEANLDKSK